MSVRAGRQQGRATGADECEMKSEDTAGGQTDTSRTGCSLPAPSVPAARLAVPRELMWQRHGDGKHGTHLLPPVRAALGLSRLGANVAVPSACANPSLQRSTEWPGASSRLLRGPESGAGDLCEAGPRGTEGERCGCARAALAVLDWPSPAAPMLMADLLGHRCPGRAPGGAGTQDIGSCDPLSQHPQPQDPPEQRGEEIGERVTHSPPAPSLCGQPSLLLTAQPAPAHPQSSPGPEGGHCSLSLPPEES